jgi:hypothetical protein
MVRELHAPHKMAIEIFVLTITNDFKFSILILSTAF